MLHESKKRRPKPNGLTLVELLVVIFIMMIFVAAAAPLVNPATSDRKIREASRQLNAYIAEAKAHAAQRGRPVGIALDQASAVREGSRDSNLVSRMYLVEVPPIYTGDTLSATVQFWCLSADQTGNFTPPSVNVGGVNRPAIKLQLNFSTVPSPTSNTSLLASPSQSPMLNSIFASYLPQGRTAGSAPFSIRMGGRGSYRVAYVDMDTTSTPPAKYYAWIVYGDPMYNYCFNAISQGLNFPNGGTVPTGISDPRAPNAGTPPNFWYYSDSFQIGLPPVVTGDSQLELPTGTVVDLQFSGYSASGTEFFDNTRLMPTPLTILFSPGGEVGFVQNYNQARAGNPFSAAAGRINLLVGTTKRDAESQHDPTIPDDRLSRIQSNAKMNLNDTSNLWVSINPRTGLVTTAENSIPQNLTTLPNAVFGARFNATKLNTKGGR